MNQAGDHGFKDETHKGITVLAPDYGRSPSEIELPKPIEERLDVRSRKMLERAKAFRCTNPEEYKAGDLVVSECAALIKRIKEIHDPICAATNTAHKVATKARKDLTDPITLSRNIVDNTLTNFKIAFEKKRAEEKRLLEEKARKEQEDAALEQAVQMEKENAPQELIDAVVEMGQGSVQVEKPEAPELSSNNSRTPDWDIVIVDKTLVPDYYKTVNEGAIRTAVRQRKGNITVPGVRIVDTFKTRAKSL